ncbi:hypothetical protein AQ737_30485 [Burkholderia pseudomallei]|nr:hypothetical protein AQ737_30485 [Burkholderia pseudomallei]
MVIAFLLPHAGAASRAAQRAPPPASRNAHAQAGAGPRARDGRRLPHEPPASIAALGCARHPPNRFIRRAVRGGARRRSASIEAMRAADSPAAHACPNRKPRGTRAMPHAVMPP